MSTQSIFALRKQSLLTHSLSKSTKQIWNHHFSINYLLDSGTTDLVLRVTNHFVKLNLTDHGIKLSKIFLEILQMFTETSEIPLHDVLLKLWNSTGSDSDTSRLRMRISRLNQQLQSELGLTNVFQLDKYSLKTKYKIIIAKSPAETISEPSN